MVEYVRMGYRRAAVCGHMTVLRSGELAMDSCWRCPTESRKVPHALPPHWTFNRGATNGGALMQCRCTHAMQMLAMRRQPIRKGSAD